jgi:flagellar hook protein FlgE
MAAHQTKLNVIGNNIANVNTYGFKASRVVFSDVLYQNLSTATGATATTGGTNASQLGYGAKVGSIDMLNTISSGATTGRALDVYIAGEGYLTVQPEAGTNRYTRVGNLKFDADGNLTDGGGSKVMGIPLDADKNPILDANGTLAIDGLEAIYVDPTELEKYTGITIGKSGEITGIRAGDPEFTQNTSLSWIYGVSGLSEASNLSGSVKATISNQYELAAGANDAEVVAAGFVAKGSSGLGDAVLTLNYDGTTYTLNDGTDDYVGTLKGNTLTFLGGSVSINDVTKLTTLDPTGATDYELGTLSTDASNVTTYSVYDKGNNLIEGTYDNTTTPGTGIITFGTGADQLVINVDDTAYQAAVTAAVDDSEIVFGKVETGSDKPITLGYLALSKFANVDGLLQDGNGYFMESANSGEAIASKAGTNGTGGTESANLEMSNVDLSQEFTDMIVAQRGFQANSRIITVSDSILEELINLKR